MMLPQDALPDPEPLPCPRLGEHTASGSDLDSLADASASRGHGWGWGSRSLSLAGLASISADLGALLGYEHHDMFHGSESYLSLASAAHAPPPRPGWTVPSIACNRWQPTETHAGSAARGKAADPRSLPPTWRGLVPAQVRGRWDAACAVPEAALHLSLLLATLGCLFRAWTEPLIARTVSGSFLNIFRPGAASSPAAGAQGLNAQYSLLQLGVLAARGGPLNVCLSVTFIAFTVVGPLLRTSTQILVLLLPLPMPSLRRLHRLSRSISVFYALEVMVVVVPLLDMAISDLANGMLTPDNMALCEPLNARYGGPCLTLHVTKLVGYYHMAAAVLLYFVAGSDGSFVHKRIHRILHPYDEPPPTFHLCTGRPQPRHRRSGGKANQPQAGWTGRAKKPQAEVLL
jgi:hypothetical protein